MTTGIAPNLQFREFQPDNLLKTFNIDLTEDQKIFLKANKTILRTPLTKQFNLKFGTNHSKLQLTRAIEIMDLPKPKPKAIKKPKAANKSGVLNVYWYSRAKKWQVQFRVKNKLKTLGYYKDLSLATKVAEEYRNNLA